MSRRELKPPVNELPQMHWRSVAIILACIAGAIGYAYFFFQDQYRVAIWRQMLFPEELLTQMWAGDLRFFGLFDRLPILFLAAWLSAAALALGRGTLRALGFVNSFDRWERNVYSVALGFAWLSWGTLLIGWAGGLRQWMFLVGIILVLGTLGCRLFFRDVALWRRERMDNRVVRICGGIGLLFTLLLFSGAVLPPWDFDVREYHLQAPKEWLQLGRIEFLPHNVYASMPLGAEMLALLAMAIWPSADGWFYGALVGKLLNASYVPLTALAIFGIGKERFTPAVGAVGGVLYLTTPWVMQTGVHGLNEPAVAAYGFFAFATLLRTEFRTAGVILAGLFAGAAAACKYPALLMLVAPLTVAAVVFPKWLAGQTLSIRSAALNATMFAAAAALICGPWFVKNAVQTGNPTYPLFVSVFGGTTRTPEKDARFRQAHAVPVDEAGSRYGWNSFTKAVGQVVLSEGQSPLLVCVAIFGLGFLLWGPRAGLTGIGLSSAGMIGWILLVWFFATHRIDRFWLPAVPFAALLGGLACRHEWKGITRWPLGALVCIGLTYNLLFALGVAGDSRRLVRLDLLRAGAALHKDDVARVPASFRYLNEHTPPGKAVLLVGDAAVFDLEPRAFYNTCWDDCLLVDWMLDPSAEERSEELRRRNIACVCVNPRELARYRSPGNYGYDPRFRDDLINELVAQEVLELVWTEPDAPLPVLIYKPRE